jgi:hypothetical protein
MPFWQRALILLAAMIGVSFIVDLLWNSLFGFHLPGYASGVVGGLTAVPLWDLLKRLKASKPG